jgi:predicted ATPase
MIKSIEFENFKALRQTTLPLGRFTLIVGPNGSGKSTALNALAAFGNPFGNPAQWGYGQLRTAGLVAPAAVTLRATWVDGWGDGDGGPITRVEVRWTEHGVKATPFFVPDPQQPSPSRAAGLALGAVRVFWPSANLIAARPVVLQPQMELDQDCANLAGVLDRLRDQNPERFDALNAELSRWIPEFDRIAFETPGQGQRAIALRTRAGGHRIKACDLSQGTLIALALLTIAYLPEPPSVVGLEEPDHGLHPRLLRDVRDALYRLAYPEGAGEKRQPVQVVATTHNPYFLDLFREHPEEIVIAEKVGLEAKFSRLSDRGDLEEILGDAPLSEVWYSGVLGGVPAGT